VSESTETFNPPSLDEVRARIFYLACDVEPVSAPAAMLLRAVADAIEDGPGERINLAGNGALTGLSRRAAEVPPRGSLPGPNGAPAPRRRFGVVTS
jgi:hypothetical protein